AEAVSALTDLEARVKWPNDVLWRGRKIAGILTELATRRDRVNFVIVSVGMNLNHTREQFPAELRGKASSLRIALRHKVDRVAVAQEFLRRLERRYGVFLKRGFSGVRRAVCRRSTLLGKSVIIEEPTGSGQRVSGRAVDIDSSGRLVVETSLGEIRLLSGEVTLEQTYQA
ncbi:MAG TPA: biotin--[acetyl-CoA-carboxylase] ligase, partial [candidate division Zixibacteria bacterium]|nr:biotin--[acetyl-CoA-carboxylase] ligase [candidate division Zixibacteria bacterium]